MSVQIKFTVSTETKAYQTGLNTDVDAALIELYSMIGNLKSRIEELQTKYPLCVESIDLDMRNTGLDRAVWYIHHVSVDVTYQIG